MKISGRKIKGLLIDIDGTLFIKGEIPKKNLEILNRLNQKNIPYLLLSNTTSKSKADIIEKFSGSNIKLKEKSVFTALESIKTFLESKKGGAFLLLSEAAKKELSHISAQPVDYVVVGNAKKNMSYNNVNQAFRYLTKGAKLISAAKTKYYQNSDGKLTLDGGAFTKALEFSSGKKAKIMGKPSKSFFNSALKRLNLSADEVLMIGDDIKNDVLGAQKHGILGILVKTGKYRKGDLKQVKSSPDLVLNDFSELKNFL